MPATIEDTDRDHATTAAHHSQVNRQSSRASHEKVQASTSPSELGGAGKYKPLVDGINGGRSTDDGTHNIPNGRPSPTSSHTFTKMESRGETAASSVSSGSAMPLENGRRTPDGTVNLTKQISADNASLPFLPNGYNLQSTSSPWAASGPLNGDQRALSNSQSSPSQIPGAGITASESSGTYNKNSTTLAPTPFSGPHPSRLSAPPAPSNPSSNPAVFSSSSTAIPPTTGIRHRHTLQVPKVSTSRGSHEFSTSNTNASDDVITSGRFSPTTTTGARRASIALVRRATRSVHSDLHIDELAPDDDAARWADAIRVRRAQKKRRKEEEEEDRVVVGTKVDQNHVNWVTAYNMLTGIRFTVSRTNAKVDRDLTDADFAACHKFSFDM